MSPIAGEGRLFREEYLDYFRANYYPGSIPIIERLHENGMVEHIPVDVAMTIDPTLTAGSDSDATGVIVKGTDSDGEWWVLLARRYTEVPSTIGDLCVLIIQTFLPRIVQIEAGACDPMMISRIQKAISELNLDVRITSYSPLRDERGHGRQKKYVRIKSLEPPFRDRKIHLLEGACADLLPEYTDWPSVDHDDVMDALAMHHSCSQPCMFKTTMEASTTRRAPEDLSPEEDFAAILPPEMRGRGPAGRVIARTGLGAQRLRAS
jgi:hypothetical protein